MAFMAAFMAFFAKTVPLASAPTVFIAFIAAAFFFFTCPKGCADRAVRR